MKILDAFSLKNKVAIVTGSSKGLGQALAVGLAEAGANIVGVSRTPQLETEKLVRENGCEFLWIKMDMLETDDMGSIIEKTLEKFGKVDILVNNAGTIRRNPALNFTEKDWDDVLNLNLKKVFLLSQAFAKQIISQGTKGKIINIASMLSFQGGINVTSYTASKHGVLGLTRILANEWAIYNINVNAIAPGYMETELTEPLIKDEKRNTEILSRIPFGRWGKPEDLKGAVVFLASDASDYITGAFIAVDGGWLSR